MPLDADKVHRNLRKLRKLLRKPKARPSAERVHDLRTGTREVDATLGALGLDRRRNERRLQSGLRRVRKRAGKVRDMDVLSRHLLALAPRDGDEVPCRVELLQLLGAERYRHADRLRAVLRRDGKALDRRLARADRRIARCLPDDSTPPPEAGAQAMATALSFASGLAMPAKLTRTTLHAYRLKVKDLRNVLKLATDADRADLVAQLGEIKDAIGEWHDLETLAALASAELSHGPRCGLVHEIRARSQRSYRHALALTNALRASTLLSGRPRRRTGVAAARRPPLPVLEATAAMSA